MGLDLKSLLIMMGVLGLLSCNEAKDDETGSSKTDSLEVKIMPVFTTPILPHDSDDPAIWYNENDPEKSLIFGTDKMEGSGGLFAFDIYGKLDSSRSIYPLDRPNNVDVGYDLQLADSTIDFVAIAERMTGSIRIYSIPEMIEVDGGGIPVFMGENNNEVMGIAIYRNKETDSVYAIVSRKENPNHDNDYLHQYLLQDSAGTIVGKLVREFGDFSGNGEIEAIAVDQELGYIYYSDEVFGVRKYHANPALGNEELAVFGKAGFFDDREGISIYQESASTGYILVSDQGANKFRVFPREGSGDNPHHHPEIAVLDLNTLSSDGSEVIAKPLGAKFPNGLFVAMSDNRTFEIYDVRDLLRGIENGQLAQND